MRVLELFAGSRSIGKVCDELGIECFSTDIEPFDGINYVCDIRDFDISKLPRKPDIIRASPPCTGFSVACIGRNRNKDLTPKTDSARLGIELLNKTIDIIAEIEPRYFFIENPRGMMRKIIDINAERHTVTYCQYGDTRMKPTDIWTNNYRWKPRPACKNGSTCHIAAPRGSRTGTQGLKGAYDRSIVPYELCKEVIMSSM